MKNKRHKYNAKAVEVEIDGQIHRFDSKHEMAVYLLLKRTLPENLKIQRQKVFVLMPPAKIDGETLAPIRYIADFLYENEEGVFVVDAKGPQTGVYRLKRNLLLRKLKALAQEEGKDFHFIEVFAQGRKLTFNKKTLKGDEK